MQTVTVVAALTKVSMTVSMIMSMIVSMTVSTGCWCVPWCVPGPTEGAKVLPAFMHSWCCMGTTNAGQWSITLDRVGSRTGVDLWEQSLPPLLHRCRDEGDSPDGFQEPEGDDLLQDCSSGLGHVQQGEPAGAKRQPDQDGDDVAGQHAAGDEGGADHEEREGQSHRWEAEPTHEASGHLGARGCHSHATESHGDRTISGAPHVGVLQEIQEAVKQPGGGGQQQEEEQKADRPDSFLRAAAQKQHRRGVEEKLRRCPVVERKHHEDVDASALENSCAQAEDAV